MQGSAKLKLSRSPQTAAGERRVEPPQTITPAEVLGLMPRGMRYLFLDDVLEVDRTHISARYRFREDETFYEGHFPDRAVTPGTVLLEAMCQCGITAHSYYFLALELGIDVARRYRVVFTDAEAEWLELVGPGTRITVHSDLLAWRLRRIQARVKVFSDANTLIAQATLAGTSLSWHPEEAAKSSPDLPDTNPETSVANIPL